MKNNPPAAESVRGGTGAIPASLRNVFIMAASVVVMLALCLSTTGIMMRHFSRTTPMQPMRPLGIVIAPDEKPLTRLPAPSLELDDGHADYLALRQQQSEKLNSYGWVDRSNGIVRIPIDRAMDLIASRGLPAAPTNAPRANSVWRLNPATKGSQP